MTEMKVKDNTVEFISDWRGRTKSQQKRFVISFVGAFIFVVLLCITVFMWFQNQNYERIALHNEKYIQDSAFQKAQQFEREMSGMVNVAINFAGQFSDLKEANPDMPDLEILKHISDERVFDRVAFIDAGGHDISEAGNADVSDREYFKKAITGEPGWTTLNKSRVTGQPAAVFYAPVYSGEKNVIGVLAGFYRQDRMDSLFSYELFNYKPDTYLLLKSGAVVANSKDDLSKDNLFAELKGKTFVGDTDYQDLMTVIEDKDMNTITFRYMENKNPYVGVLVQFKGIDWMIMSILPYDVTRSMVSNANTVGRHALLVVAISLILCVTALLGYLRRQQLRFFREMEIAEKELIESDATRQRQLYIVESLANIYSSVYYINLITGKYERIKENENTVLSIPDAGSGLRGFDIYVEQFVDDSYKEKMSEFVDLSTIKSRLEENDILSMVYLRADGKWRRGYLIMTEHAETGEPESVIFAVQQIDKEKKKDLKIKTALEEAYEAAKVADEAKTTFLSNMSHDIRTPLNAIVGMTAIAGAHIDSQERVAECLRKITSSSKHLLGLVNEVLDMSKIESGKVDLNEEDFNISELIDGLIAANQPLIAEKNHTLVVKILHLEHENVIGDSIRLQQVFNNLLGNAIKYTPAGGRLEISVSEKETNKRNIGWYEVSFKDNGIGMSEEFCRTLFEPFTRAEDERVSHIQGTGLGMSIARNIIRMMNGDIMVESEIDKGSTFTVSFSLRLQEENEVDYRKFTDLPVLVVDDDVFACESTSTMLDSLGMKSEWVTSGREAVDRAVEHHQKQDDYYALIIDWKMEGMNGIETTREIRKQIGDEIPIIVMSAYDWTDIEKEAKDAGVNAFLSKPLFKSKLVNLFQDLADQGEDKSKNETKELLQPVFEGKRILMAEDNEINREVAVGLLTMTGLVVDTVENGKLCVEKFTASPEGYYDLILMDVQMPVMNGYEATKGIRESGHADAGRIPIIAMTAYAFSTDVRAAMDAGMNGHLSKPIEIKKVMQVLREQLQSSEE